MKNFLKLTSTLVLFVHISLGFPLDIFAKEQITDPYHEQVQLKSRGNTASTEHSSIDSSQKEESETTEISTTSSSESSTQSSESSTMPSSETSSSSSSETKPSESTTPSNTEEPNKSKPDTKPEEPKTTSETSQPEEQEASEPVSPQFTQTSDIEQGAAYLNQPIEVSGIEVAQDGSIHFEKDETVDSFIAKIGEPARKIGQEKDLYASVMIAQAILESGSGSSSLSKAPNYNLFGIKGTYNGKSVSMATQEDLGNGTMYTTQSGFRVYENYEDCFNDYATLLTEGTSGNSNYYAGAWKSNTKTYQEATKFLTGRYATDTQYNQKLDGLIETYELSQYDKELQGPQISMTGYKVPVNNYTISSVFGNRGGEFHRGLDMAAAQGEPIYAVKSGKVLTAEFHNSWGNYVVIQHDDGSTALYAHQRKFIVNVGDSVSQSQIIGYVGSTGHSTGSHLHIELCLDDSLDQNKLIDPQLELFD